MKRFFLSFVALIFATISFAQIEEFDASSFSKHDAKPVEDRSLLKKAKLVEDPFPPILYEDGHSYGRLIKNFNIIGHKVYYVSNPERGEWKRTDIITLSAQNMLKLETPVEKSYYNVIDILVLAEEKEELCNRLKVYEYVGDTTHYIERAFMAWKDKAYTFSKEEVIQMLRRCNAIYILQDDNNNLYYIPNGNRRWEHGEKRCGVALYPNLEKTENRMRITGLNIVTIDEFISVNSYEYYKNKFEGVELVKSAYYDPSYRRAFMDYSNEDLLEFVYFVEKVSIKDSKIALTIYNKKEDERSVYDLTDTFRKSKANDRHRNDSIDVIWPMPFALRVDADSLLHKWEQEELKAKREELARNERKRDELIRQYGAEYAQCIIDGRVCVGMTKQMCKEAKGTPDRIEKQVNLLGEVDVWIYTGERIMTLLGGESLIPFLPTIAVTFVNGKVTSVDEFSNSVL